MKNQIGGFLIALLLLLGGCGGAETDPSAPDAALTAYLTADTAQPAAVGEAVEAYNRFLNGKIPAKTAHGEWYAADSRTPEGIIRYALLDVNGDGIPELHGDAMHYRVFSYTEGQVVLWFTSGHNKMNGPVYPLENGAIFTESSSLGYTFTYTAFDWTGTATTVEFSRPAEGRDDEYVFAGDTVSKGDYDRLTKE